MAWVAIAGVTSYPIINPQINKRIEGANTASFQCLANIPVGTAITIKSNGTTVYYGKVRSIKRRTDNLNTVELMEEASDLKLFRLEDSGSGIVTIDNPNGTRYLSSYISSILDGTGWTGSTTENTNRIPGTSDPLPSVRFYNSTVAKALEKMIVLVCGYKMWFDNAQKLVKYGNWNVDRSASALAAVEVRPIASDINYAIDRVIVIGKTEDISGTATVGSPGTPPKTLMYQYTECADSAEAQSIANQILADRSILMERFECDILPGNYIYNEGDRVKISDARSGITGTYGVKDVTISVEKTTLGLGCSEITIFDLLGDKLTEISGSSFEGTQSTFSGGAQNISSTSPAEWNIDVQNKDNVSNFKLKLELGKFKTPAQLQSAAAGLNNSNLDTTGITVSNRTTGVNANLSSTGLTITTRGRYNSMGMITSLEEPQLTTISSDNSYASVIEYDYDPRTFDNAEFTFVFLSVYLMTASTGTIKPLYARLVNGAGVVAHAAPVYPIYNSSSNEMASANFTFICAPGVLDSYAVGNDDTLYAQVAMGYVSGGGASNIMITVAKLTITYIDSHKHYVIEPPEGGHSTTINNPEHDHPNTDEGHQTTYNLDSHSHPSPTSQTEINSYPQNINILITNSFYNQYNIGTYVGGSATTIPIDITSYLRSGTNKIKITSTTAGSILMSGSFESFGV